MRKKILLAVAVILCVLQVSAQFQKHQLYSDFSASHKIGQTSYIDIRPSFSIGLSEHSRLGVFYDYTKFRDWTYQNHTGQSTKYGVGVSYDYYRYFKNSQKWGWFVNASASFNRVNVYDKTSGTPVINMQYNQTELSLTPGIFFKPSPRIMLHADIGGVNFSNSRHDFILVRSNFITGPTIGVTINLGKLKK